MKAKKEDVRPTAISNRKARHDYQILDTFEAGIVLKGPEVKSLRQGKGSLQDSFARVERNELWLYNMHILPYAYTHHVDLSPTRTRKLLVHRQQLNRLESKVQEKGMTLIPLEVFFNAKGMVKVNLGVAKGKLAPDKRTDLKKKDLQRDIRREFKGKLKL